MAFQLTFHTISNPETESVFTNDYDDANSYKNGYHTTTDNVYTNHYDPSYDINGSYNGYDFNINAHNKHDSNMKILACKKYWSLHVKLVKLVLGGPLRAKLPWTIQTCSS